MGEHVIIDGNNLLHALHDHAPLPVVGRETVVRIIERWAKEDDASVTIVFDGPRPQGGLAKQMSGAGLSVRFSAPQTADDIIVDLIHKAQDPTSLRIVTSDNAIAHEARARRCQHTSSADFARELFPRPDSSPTQPEPEPEKPGKVTPGDGRDWMDEFGVSNDEEPFDGHDAMMH